MLPSREAEALSSECSHENEFSKVSPPTKALLVTNLKCVVVGKELIEGLCNIAGPLGILPRGVGGSESRENSLVGVDEAFEMESVVADIGDVEKSVLGQLALHAEEEVLNVAVMPVLGNPCDVIGGRVEGSDQPGRKSLIGGDVAAWRVAPTAMICAGTGVLQTLVGRCGLRNRCELCLRSIDAR